MRNRWLLNLGLLVLVVLLGVALFYKHNTDQRPSLPALTTLPTDEIERVRIAYPDNEQLTLEKQTHGWALVKPLRARASDFKLRGLFALASAPAELRLPATDDNLRKFGLDKPKARVWLNDEEIAIGPQHLFKPTRYVLYRDHISLVPAHLFTPASYRLPDLLSTRLVEEQRTPVAVELPGLSLRFHDGVWRLQPEDKEIGADRINAFVDRWQRARAFAVAPYAGAPLRDRIRITLRDDRSDANDVYTVLELGILSHRPEFVLYRVDEGLEYRFTEDNAKRLLDIKSE